MAIADYNTDPDLNVDISGINIAEGCPPSGINNALRQMMADVKTFTDSPTFSGGITVTSGATISGGATADTLTVTSGATISGGMTVDGKGIVYDSGDQTISGTKTFNGIIYANGNVSFDKTATINGVETRHACTLTMNDASLRCGLYDTTNSKWAFRTDANGTVLVDEKTPVYTSTNQTIGGTKTFSSDIIITSTEGRLKKQSSAPAGGNIGFSWHNTTSSIDMLYVQGWWNNDNAGLTLASRNTSDSNKYYAVSLRSHSTATHYFEPTIAGIYLGRNASGYKWKQVIAESATISTSDEREKSNISTVPDDVLDAWGDVQWSQFQMNEAIADKGEANARQHTGLVAQRIDAVFRAHNLDISRYGLFCWDSWAAEPEERDENGNIISPAQEASDAYALRYEEALAMEAAYQRRRADRAEARITALEQRLAEMEQAIAALAGGAE